MRAISKAIARIATGIAIWAAFICLFLLLANKVLAGDAGITRYGAGLFSQMTEAEYHELCKVVELEAGTEDLTGRQAVVEVIANRAINDNYFADTLHGVVKQRGQFSTYKPNGKKWKNAIITQGTIDAIESVRLQSASVMEKYIIEGKQNGTVKDWVTADDYVFFCTPGAYAKKGYRYMHNCIRIGGHVFGTMKGR